MGRPPRLQEPGQIFHVIVRGNRRQNIFEEEADWDRFQTALLRLAAESDFELLGFTLMGNHAHLLIRCGGTPLGKLLQGLLSSHALYLNKKYGRSGHLYQGRYTSEPCPNDSVLKHQLRYIHWNPVRAGLVRSPDEWKWSSHHAYCGQEMPGVSTGFILGMFAEDRGRAYEIYREFAKVPEEGNPFVSDMASLASRMERDRGFEKGVIAGPRRGRPVAKLRKDFIRRAAKANSPKRIAEFLNRSESFVNRILRENRGD